MSMCEGGTTLEELKGLLGGRLASFERFVPQEAWKHCETHGCVASPQYVEHFQSFFRDPGTRPTLIQCEHGFHHHAQVHGCDFAAHADQCPYQELIRRTGPCPAENHTG